MNVRRCPLILILSLLCLGRPSLAADAMPTASQRLASELIRVAFGRTSVSPLTVHALETAVLLSREAVALDPDSAEMWQMALDVATLAEQEDLKDQAVEKLSRLDPANEPVRLMRLMKAVEQFQTYEERVAAYQTLLDDANIPRLGPAVASRLALELALLYQRQGETQNFSTWLTKALTWDSSNRSAAALAAGFFRTNVNDPVADAELLVNLLLADPTDIATQITLSQLLLEHGAYASANRMFSMAFKCISIEGTEPKVELFTDFVIAKWASGDAEGALDAIRQWQMMMDERYRMYMLQQMPQIDPDDLKKLTSPLVPTLALIGAVIHVTRSDQDAPKAVADAVAAQQFYSDSLKQVAAVAAQANKPLTDAERLDMAENHLKTAWIKLWLGPEFESATADLATAADFQPMTAEARARFDGWLAYRRGELDQAIAALEPLAPKDDTARLGLALAYQAQGLLQDAAREMLAVYRAQPGSLIGLYAQFRLSNLLGQRVGPANFADALDRLIASVPQQFDRFVTDPTYAMSMRIVPVQTTFDPYEPLMLRVEFANNSQFPLGFGRNGPLRPMVMLMPTMHSVDLRGPGDLRPVIVSVYRRLRLGPREKFTVDINLRNYGPGDLMNAMAVNGSILKLSAILNFAVPRPGAPVAGLYGTQIDVPVLRIDGIRQNDEWIRDTLQAMRGQLTDDVVIRMAMFSHKIAPRLPFGTSNEDHAAMDQMRTAFAEAFARLDPASQAWLLAVMPQGTGTSTEGLASILAIARKSADRLVQLAYLLYQSTGPDDPMFDAAKRSDDPALRRLAELVLEDIKQTDADSKSPPATPPPTP